MTTYRKTEKGQAALEAGSAAGLVLQDRRVLILADGRRPLAQLASMLGADVVARVQRLERDGLLAPVGAQDSGNTTQPAPSTAPSPAPPTAVATRPTPAAPAQRRSLAAAKMYLLDMLQLQRSADAAELSGAIRCATDPDRQLDAMMDGLRHLLATSKPSYGERVVQRLASMLPEGAAGRVEALARPATPRLSVVA